MAPRIVPKRLITPILNRTFSVVAPPQKPYFLVIIPDKPGSTSLRTEVRPQVPQPFTITHLQDIFPNVVKGSLKIGGPLFENVEAQNESPRQVAYGGNVVGSCVIWSAESKEEVLETLKKDIYVEKGVWDFGKVQIYPFKPTFAHQFDN